MGGRYSVQFRTLIAHDVAAQRHTLTSIFQRAGHAVTTVTGGADALEAMSRTRFDLLLLKSAMMPPTGLEVLSRIRAQHDPRLVVIMLTPSDRGPDVVQALDVGANDCVREPIEESVLLARVRAQLRSRTASSAQVESLTPPRSGKILAGRYELIECVGEGGYGTVYRAQQLDLERQVAIKLLESDMRPGDVSVERFHREGVAACRVRHQNAVMVLDFGTAPDGISYLVMEYLEGESLADLLDRQGRLTPSQCANVLVGVCSALDAAHHVGIVHRDIKPSNIFLHRTPQGMVPKVLDFGVAKMIGANAVEKRLTAEGFVLGTPTYMAPERFRGECTGKSDVYSVGVVLFELLTGEPPYKRQQGTPASLARQHLKAPIPSLGADFPELLDELVTRALDKTPQYRPSASELAEAIPVALTGAKLLPRGRSSAFDDIDTLEMAADID